MLCSHRTALFSLLARVSIAGMVLYLAASLNAAQMNHIAKVAAPDDEASLKLDALGNPVIAFRSGSLLQLAHCANPTCSSGTSVQTIDTGSLEDRVSVVIPAAGNPIVAYFFGNLDTGNGELRIASCGDVNCSSGNTITTPDQGLEGLSLYMVLDSVGNPVVSYTGGTGLKLLHCGNPSCTSGNSIILVDPQSGQGYGTGLALDSSGSPVISYIGTGTTPKVHVVHCHDPNCTSHSKTAVDVAGFGNTDNTDLVLDGAGNPVVSYYHIGHRIAHCGNPNCTANNVVTTVDASGLDGGKSSLLLGNNGNPIVTYTVFQGGKNQLTVLTCGDANCASGNVFAHPDTSNDNGLDSSLRLDAQGRPVISYQRFDQQLNSSLLLLHCGTTTCN